MSEFSETRDDRIWGKCKSCGEKSVQYCDGDGAYEETWYCRPCDIWWTVPITVERHFDEMEMDSISRREE